MESGPWFFDKALILFEDLKGYKSISNLDFKYASFWIHFNNLPLVGFTRKIVGVLGNMVGEFEKVDPEEEERWWNKTLWMRVKMDISKPLRRLVNVKVRSMAEVSKIPITYENLGDFCYGYGLIRHLLKDCETHRGTLEKDLQYSSVLHFNGSIQNGGKGGSKAGKSKGKKRNGWRAKEQQLQQKGEPSQTPK